jgi:prepilin-type N-terminal cleavage/methylation domain-containing protein
MQNRGFTLIEIMVALAIFGLLIALAGPQLGTFLASSQVRNAGDAILNGVQQAQATAMRDNLPTRLELTTTTGTGGWELIVADPAANTVPGANPATPCGVPVVCAPGNVCNPEKLFCLKDGAPDAQLAVTPAGAVAGNVAAVTFDGFGRIQCNTDNTLACDGTTNMQWIKITNSKNSLAREMHVCITDRQAPNAAGSVPVSASQFKLCDPNVAATEPQACPASCV